MRLYYTKVEQVSEVQPLCSICLVHDFGDYSGRYLHLAEALVLQGMEVNMLDLRGFGYSGGPRACSPIYQLH